MVLSIPFSKLGVGEGWRHLGNCFIENVCFYKKVAGWKDFFALHILSNRSFYVYAKYRNILVFCCMTSCSIYFQYFRETLKGPGTNWNSKINRDLSLR